MKLFNLSNDQANLETIEQRISDSSNFNSTNFLLLILAIFIASIGLNVNSIPVIIGAMLISPLMGPIIGIGYFIVRNDFDNLKKALFSLFKFLSLSVVISSLYFYVSPINILTNEISNRINPNIWDAFIAFFGGIAGIIAITRKDFTNIFPGVAIATSLMPPLCTMGYGIAHFNFEIIINAFYLFFLNGFFIALSTILMLHLIHIPEIQLEKKSRIKHYIILSLVVSIILTPSFFKGKEIITNEIFDLKVHNLINEINKNNIIILSSDSNKKSKTLTLSLVEDEKISSIDFSDFNKKYHLNLNLLKKQEKINVEQIKEQLRDELEQKNKTIIEQANLNKKTQLDNLTNSLKNDLILINHNIDDVILNKETNSIIILTHQHKLNIESLKPFIENKLNVKNLNIVVYLKQN